MTIEFGKRGGTNNTEIKPRTSVSQTNEMKPPRMPTSQAAGLVAVCTIAVAGAVAGLNRFTNVVAAKRDYANAMKQVHNLESHVTSNGRQVTAIEVAHNGPAFPSVNIITLCREKWPRDFHMREVCEADQRTSKEASEKEDFSTEVRVICANQWREDWHMYLYCARNQAVAQAPVDQRAKEPTVKIEDHCRREWPNNYTMRESCENRQQDARADLHGHAIDDDIARHCASDWPDNWVMFKDCVGRQEQAKSRL